MSKTLAYMLYVYVYIAQRNFITLFSKQTIITVCTVLLCLKMHHNFVESQYYIENKNQRIQANQNYIPILYSEQHQKQSKNKKFFSTIAII